MTQRLEVGVVDLLLLVGQHLEVGEDPVELLVGEPVAQLDEALLQGVAPRSACRAPAASLVKPTSSGRMIVGLAVGEHAVLVDAGLGGRRRLRRRWPCSAATELPVTCWTILLAG